MIPCLPPVYIVCMFRPTLFLLSLLGSLLALEARASVLSAQADTTLLTSPDTLVHPNEVPYETDYGIGHHVLAFPSYVVHWVTRPVGWAIRWYEEGGFTRRTRTLIFDDSQPVTVSPLIEFGGATMFSFGAGVTWRKPFGLDHRTELSYRYSTPQDMEAKLYYDVPHPFGASSYLRLNGVFHLDSRNKLFIGGNDSSPTNQANFRVERGQVGLAVGTDPQLQSEPTSRFGWSLLGNYRRIETGKGRGDATRPLPTNLPGLGAEHYGSLGLGLVADAGEYFRFRELARPVAGTRIRMGYEYNQALNPNADSYHRMLAEWQQHLPLPFLGAARRLAFGARMEKRETVTAGDAVPFYDLSTLGNTNSLRGYDYNRFRDEGAIFFTAEYHYPVWDALDVMLFVDAGQVFSEFAEIGPENFHWSYGAGLYIYSNKGLAVRLELGITPEGIGTFSRTETLFERSASIHREFR